MNYSDKYPNGCKSGYSSAERERRMSEYNDGIEREKKAQQKIRERYEQERAQQERQRQGFAEHSEKRIKVIKYLTNQKRENYKK